MTVDMMIGALAQTKYTVIEILKIGGVEVIGRDGYWRIGPGYVDDCAREISTVKGDEEQLRNILDKYKEKK